eukprot:jgi/Mesen1/6326/ME000328S05612
MFPTTEGQNHTPSLSGPSTPFDRPDVDSFTSVKEGKSHDDPALRDLAAPGGEPSLTGSSAGLSSHSNSWTSFLAIERKSDDAFFHSTGEAIPGLEHLMVDTSELLLGDRVASGSFGRVYFGTYREREVAVKIVRWDKLELEPRLMLDEQFKQEVSMLAVLDHPNVVKFHGAYKNKTAGCLVTEYLHGGDLREFTAGQMKRRSPLSTILKMALDVAKGMEYLHSKGIVHRDLKTSNLLLSLEGIVKIVDFGAARSEGRPHDMTGETGTFRYMAPEMIDHKPYTKTVDVYSFGIVLWELVTGEVPYDGMSSLQAAFGVARKNLRPPAVKGCPAVLNNLMQMCWHAQPQKRPTFASVVSILSEFLGQSKTGRGLKKSASGRITSLFGILGKS